MLIVQVIKCHRISCYLLTANNSCHMTNYITNEINRFILLKIWSNIKWGNTEHFFVSSNKTNIRISIIYEFGQISDNRKYSKCSDSKAHEVCGGHYQTLLHFTAYRKLIVWAFTLNEAWYITLSLMESQSLRWGTGRGAMIAQYIGRCPITIIHGCLALFLGRLAVCKQMLDY